MLERLPTRQAAALVREMTPTTAPTSSRTWRKSARTRSSSKIPAAEREETERLLAYEPDTAGGLMTTEFVSVSEDERVEDALAGVRRIARGGRREAMHAIYAVDQQGTVKGVMSLHELLAAPGGRAHSRRRMGRSRDGSPDDGPRRSCASDVELRPGRPPRRGRPCTAYSAS